jgi:hypothetical protein
MDEATASEGAHVSFQSQRSHASSDGLPAAAFTHLLPPPDDPFNIDHDG